MQVLVLFHVLHSSAWYSPAHLLPFSQRMHEKAAQGRAAIGSQKTVKLTSFERAVKVAGPAGPTWMHRFCCDCKSSLIEVCRNGTHM